MVEITASFSHWAILYGNAGRSLLRSAGVLSEGVGPGVGIWVSCHIIVGFIVPPVAIELGIGGGLHVLGDGRRRLDIIISLVCLGLV